TGRPPGRARAWLAGLPVAKPAVKGALEEWPAGAHGGRANIAERKRHEVERRQARKATGTANRALQSVIDGLVDARRLEDVCPG
ncbi:MAG: hypothetical protein NHG36_18790, partial [Chromatiaceae bacterium]|nr:hypothetical protein [Candidatus Thioaporhodococcus sediminis]